MACLISFLNQIYISERFMLSLKGAVYKEHSYVTGEEFLTKKIGLSIDTHSVTANTLRGSSRAVEKSILL